MEALGDLVLPWRCVQSSHDRRRFAPNVQVETTSLLEAYSTFFMGPKECRLLRKKHAAGRRVDPQDCVFGSQHLKHGRHGSTWRIIPGTVVIESPPLIYKPWGVPATLFKGNIPRSVAALSLTMGINHLQVLGWSSKYKLYFKCLGQYYVFAYPPAQ